VRAGIDKRWHPAIDKKRRRRGPPNGIRLMEALCVLALYFAPAIIAGSRGHLSAPAIFALNLLLGWTALGWIAALVWSLTGNTRAIQREIHGTPHRQGVLTERTTELMMTVPWIREGGLTGALRRASEKRHEKRELREQVALRQAEFQLAREAKEDILPWNFERSASGQSSIKHWREDNG
jgi:hypothetical protein